MSSFKRNANKRTEINRIWIVMLLTLSIVHEVYLTKEERYVLAKGRPVETTGVSVPVWSSEEFTTEPAEEIFCQYILLNNNDPVSIDRTANGYLVTLPSLVGYKPPNYPSNETWRSVPETVREAWYDKHKIPPSGKNLLDVQDGGSAYLRFKYRKKMQHKDHFVNVFHYIELKDMKTLEDSFV